MSSSDHQRIVRVPGARRARLTPAPGTSGEPGAETADAATERAVAASGPNDERLRREVPPHY
ncbi:hypothetical protein [Microbacterium sp.]|uniref:hypothetical protein n=1 Tax=Microbacterium sp. TaxID=51671 RepID=UPI0039E71EBB